MKDWEDLYFAVIMVLTGIVIGWLIIAPLAEPYSIEPQERVEYVVGKLRCPVCGENLVLNLDVDKLRKEVYVHAEL